MQRTRTQIFTHMVTVCIRTPNRVERRRQRRQSCVCVCVLYDFRNCNVSLSVSLSLCFCSCSLRPIWRRSLIASTHTDSRVVCCVACLYFAGMDRVVWQWLCVVMMRSGVYVPERATRPTRWQPPPSTPYPTHASRHSSVYLGCIAGVCASRRSCLQIIACCSQHVFGMDLFFISYSSVRAGWRRCVWLRFGAVHFLIDRSTYLLLIPVPVKCVCVCRRLRAQYGVRSPCNAGHIHVKCTQSNRANASVTPSLSLVL